MMSGSEENVVVGGSPVSSAAANDSASAANASASAAASAAASASASAATTAGFNANALAEAQARIMAMPVSDENAALNIMVSFLNMAQRRGVFSLDESAKIWECIKKFHKMS